MLVERGVRAADVSHLLCRVPAGEAAIICDPWERKQAPDTGHAARWSLPIVVAARIVEGKVDLATFESGASAAVRELAARVQWEPLPDARFPERFEAEIVCDTSAGASHTIRIDDVYGNRTRPPGAEKVMAKFFANAERCLTPHGGEAVAQAARHLMGAREIGALSRALRPSA